MENYIETAEQYLRGKLPEDQRQAFEKRLQTDASFYQKVLALQHLNDGLENTSLLRFMDTLQNIPASNASTPQSYTLEELLQMFGTVEHYERELVQMATRSKSQTFQIEQPSNGSDCSEQTQFVLSSNAPTDLQLIIENSSEDEVAEVVFPAHTDQLTINTKAFLPGRYYWKLIGNTQDTLWGFFFIKKDLLPDELN